MWVPSSKLDNLVSWTSSILCAVIYMFYQRAYYREKPENIYLCITDTTRFADMTFMWDLDLIKAFKEDSEGLCSLEGTPC